MNKIYRIGHEEPGIAEFQISKFGNSEIDSLPLTPWAALGSLSPRSPKKVVVQNILKSKSKQTLV
jgi:hypothetical protein